MEMVRMSPRGPGFSAGFASCCVLSFNRIQFLRQSLDSMKAHAEYPMEIVVHDDGSTQPLLPAYLENLIGNGEVSTVIRNPPGHNQGQGIALNRMFDIAHGDPIIKLDHDLIYKPGWLRKGIHILERNMDAPDEPPIGALGLFKYSAPPVEHTEMHIRDWPEWEEVQDFVGSGFLVPRYVWEKYRPFEERSEAFAEDIDFKKRIQADGYALALPPEDLADNIGFGLGPSTVAVERDGELTSERIKSETYVIEG
jgi:glycosyltransferase involved in cell wall biosynthesis